MSACAACDWQPAGDLGAGFYRCSKCERVGKRRISGKNRGQILPDRARPEPTVAESQSRHIPEDDLRPGSYARATNRLTGGHANHRVDRFKR